ncbi:MAG: hypothetical protein DI588_03655 [Flavobacterium johnsoniae]|nr:MAG: hypothetical protein DI588_03655 [Flavobacterium johnsoniae]
MENKLPKGWVETNFENIISVMTNGRNFKQEDVFVEGYFPISRIETISQETIDLKKVKYVKIEKSDIEKYCLKIGDILFSHINSDKHLGKTAIYKQDVNLVHGINLLLLRTEKKISPDFTNFYLQYFRFRGGFLNIAQRAVNQSSINQKKLSLIPFPLPPLAEQERIVAKLDALFAQHEAMKKALGRIPQLLKDFRTQVLMQAVTGKLTKKWREENELEEWKFKKLGDICNLKAGKFVPASEIKNETEEGYFPCYGGNGLRGFVNSYTHIGKYSLIGRQGALCGNVHLIEGQFHATEHALVVTPVLNIDETWLFHKLTSLELINYSKGVAQPGLSVMNLNPIMINIPPFEEQQEIVNLIESLFSKADTIEKRYKILKEKIDSLPQAILHKAFKGELVPQLPTDGDAKDLLEEILKLKKEVTKK